MWESHAETILDRQCCSSETSFQVVRSGASLLTHLFIKFVFCFTLRERISQSLRISVAHPHPNVYSKPFQGGKLRLLNRIHVSMYSVLPSASLSTMT